MLELFLSFIISLSLFLNDITYFFKAPTGQITEYGIYEEHPDDVLKTVQNSSTTNPSTKLHSLEPVLMEYTRKIAIEESVSFGFDYELHNLPNGDVEFEWQVTHPEMVKADGSSSTDYTYTRKHNMKDHSYYGYSAYTLEEPYELVAGEWTFSYSYKGKELLKQSFVTYWESSAKQ
ncbi:DUF3859 domain-containing protein [Aliamphritea ceti]|uniref:DUF3859 domain-containing protein n=1 Tax=Aliamphritea ceti TaxID=1524258 RepID=UPI0021C36BE0|nr:DUF3859 domain-containing protein [Aliamphritea ceti]